MPRTSSRQDLSLKSLEVFQACAREGSLQAATDQTGLSVSTMSHHLRALEDHLGVALFNHARRPMTLTPKGRAFLRNIDVALTALRKAKAEASSGVIGETGQLRIGAIEDLDSDITPELAVYLTAHMPRCELSFRTHTSRTVLDRLARHELDLGVTTAPTERLRDLRELPLLKDPFVLAVPVQFEADTIELMQDPATPPFLHFAQDLIIARQIDAQLRRTGFNLPFRFESDNNQTLMAMVASGKGWTITTPMLFSRARRFHDRVRIHPFPGRKFARHLSLLATADCARSVVQLVDARLRQLILQHAIDPLCKQAPWLEDQFALID
ncbi:MAG: LysR family transcriptional regulator [Pseudomonadota bacterium]